MWSLEVIVKSVNMMVFAKAFSTASFLADPLAAPIMV